MHSAWNSCPHGRLITLLSPSTYSSRQTAHSTCLPVYFRRHNVEPCLFDENAFLDATALAGVLDLDLERGTSEALRGPINGSVGDADSGLADRVELADEEGVGGIV